MASLVVADGKPLGIGVTRGETVKRGGSFRMGIAGEVAIQLDPHVSRSDSEWHVFRNIYDTLLDVDDKLTILPGLAERRVAGDDADAAPSERRQVP